MNKSSENYIFEMTLMPISCDSYLNFEYMAREYSYTFNSDIGHLTRKPFGFGETDYYWHCLERTLYFNAVDGWRHKPW